MSKILLSALVLLLYMRSEAQLYTSVRLDKDTVLIGDPVTMEIKIGLRDGTSPAFIDVKYLRQLPNQKYPADSITQEKAADLSVLDWGTWKVSGDADSLEVTPDMIRLENGKPVIINTVKFAVYNSGSYLIPSPDIRQDGSAGDRGGSARLEVMLPARLLNQDTTLFNPIRDIIREKKTLSDYMGYLYGLAGLLLMAGLAYYFVRSKKKSPAMAVVPEEVVPPHLKALQALRELDSRQLWQQGKIKEYQGTLTDIIRTYLEERYQFAAMEMTTAEILHELGSRDFDMAWGQKLTEILQVADLVKFAKAQPDANIHSRFMDLATEFVVKTSPAEEPKTDTAL